MLGLQFHVEADHTRIERWLIGHAHELASHRIDPNRIRVDAATSGQALADVAVGIMRAWRDGAETAN